MNIFFKNKLKPMEFLCKIILQILVITYNIKRERLQGYYLIIVDISMFLVYFVKLKPWVTSLWYLQLSF